MFEAQNREISVLVAALCGDQISNVSNGSNSEDYFSCGEVRRGECPTALAANSIQAKAATIIKAKVKRQK
jgi:hypothetical protein